MICITGDTHGDFNRFKDKNIKSLKKGDTLIICGDFGFVWDNTPKERSILNKIGKFKFNTLFVDGCNENFAFLDDYPETELFGGKAACICGNLYRLQRGGYYTIEGKSFFAFGGGVLSDNERPRGSELPTAEEMEKGLENLRAHGNKADFIITHEPPQSLKRVLDFETGQIDEFNIYLDKISSEVQFDRWFFGKTHRNKVIPPKYRCIFDETEILAVSGQ